MTFIPLLPQTAVLCLVAMPNGISFQRLFLNKGSAWSDFASRSIVLCRSRLRQKPEEGCLDGLAPLWRHSDHLPLCRTKSPPVASRYLLSVYTIKIIWSSIGSRPALNINDKQIYRKCLLDRKHLARDWKLSQPRKWGWLASGMSYCVVW